MVGDNGATPGSHDMATRVVRAASGLPLSWDPPSWRYMSQYGRRMFPLARWSCLIERRRTRAERKRERGLKRVPEHVKERDLGREREG